MADAQHGSTFDEFYLACFDRLVGQLALITGSLPEAEDVVQEAFLRAAARWTWLRHYDVPEQWVRRVALRLASNHFRRARRRAAALVRLGPPPATPPASADALALDAALRTLPIRSRQVVVLHYLLGLSVQEVGRELVLPVGTVKSQLHRARQALARKLAEPDPEVNHRDARSPRTP
jgi:RNA polymerase sigma-70 factor, ECF subfamily